MISLYLKFFNKNINSNRIYFDHASATPVEDFVLNKYVEISKCVFANASSIHTEGEKSKDLLIEAKKRIANCLKARSHNVYFTSSTTEANNIFIKGVFIPHLTSPYKGEENSAKSATAEIIYSSSDHSAIIEPILWCKKFLENEKNKINLIDVKPNKIGKILIDDIAKSLNKNTKLICLSYVNSETGTIQEVKKISQEVKKICNKNQWSIPKIFIDATQAIKYFEIDVHNLGVDGISFGFSKLGGIAGSAVLWVKDQDELISIISGGGQEEGIRSGTENIPAIVANSYLLEKVCDRKLQQEKREYVYGLRNYLIQQITPNPSLSRGELVQIFGDTHFKYNKFFENSAPHILLISLKDMLGEELCLRLDSRNISVSTATACSLLENSGSNFLKSINEPIIAKETVRISLSPQNIKQEIDYLVKSLKDIANKFVK